MLRKNIEEHKVLLKLILPKGVLNKTMLLDGLKLYNKAE